MASLLFTLLQAVHEDIDNGRKIEAVAGSIQIEFLGIQARYFRPQGALSTIRIPRTCAHLRGLRLDSIGAKTKDARFQTETARTDQSRSWLFFTFFLLRGLGCLDFGR
jgi:hypothetical protein